ncbi:MAG: hypothetical protein GY861_01465 [bacterium]|nr:hypothetical protein [bacterium]
MAQIEFIVVAHDDLTDVKSDMDNAGMNTHIDSYRYSNNYNVLITTYPLDEYELDDLLGELYEYYGYDKVYVK